MNSFYFGCDKDVLHPIDARIYDTFVWIDVDKRKLMDWKSISIRPSLVFTQRKICSSATMFLTTLARKRGISLISRRKSIHFAHSRTLFQNRTYIIYPKVNVCFYKLSTKLSTIARRSWNFHLAKKNAPPQLHNSALMSCINIFLKRLLACPYDKTAKRHGTVPIHATTTPVPHGHPTSHTNLPKSAKREDRGRNTEVGGRWSAKRSFLYIISALSRSPTTDGR